MRNEDLRTELEYFSEDYDEEREMEPMPEPRRDATLTLRLRSYRVRRQRERVVGFEDASKKEGYMRGRNAEDIGPSEIETREGENRRANLPPLLAAHLGRNENSQPLRSSLTSVQGRHQPSTNVGETSLITDYPLPNGLKMPSHIGSYDRKEDPDNLLHLFEGAIHMQKWLMSVAYHMFTYTLKDFARIWWHSQKADSGLHEEQRISGFVHGLRTRNLVEHLSTDLPSTYKGLMEKTYTWVEAREEILATIRAARSFEPPPKMFGSKRSRDMSKYCHFHEDYEHDTNDCRHLKTQIQEAVNSGQLSHLVKGIKKERTKSSNTPRGESRKDKGRTVMQRMGIVVSTIHGAIKFHTEKGTKTVLSIDEANEGTKRAKRIPATSKKRVLSYVNAEEKFIVKDNHIKPIKQNKRGLGPDRSMTACKKTEELTKAEILRKAKRQTWVANPVMVKKSAEGCRMHVDFTDINNACPKDYAYKGYHQIQMAEEDEDKTAFYAGERVFCYKKMPFGLKNAGATYQRLVDKVFSHQIGRNLEIYVDDMVIKSPFLGYLITKHGIKANPSKHKAVTDLDQPRTLKDIQSLNEKLAALIRSLSKGAKRPLAFFKVLKGCKDKKSIKWTTETDNALEKIKKLVQTLPTLTAPRVGETLTMHLAASKEMFLRREEKETPTDFLVEIASEDNEKKEKLNEVLNSSSKWRLYTDGASNSDGSGAGLMLIDPEGLQIAQEMEIEKVAIFLESQLLEPEQESRCAKQAGINDLRTSHE
nr:hypothetical protein [Tanacetum cinerariifolium]